MLRGWSHIVNQGSGRCLQQALLKDYRYCGIGSVLAQSWRGKTNKRARPKGSCLGVVVAACNTTHAEEAGQLWALHHPAKEASHESLLEHPSQPNPNVFPWAKPI